MRCSCSAHEHGSVEAFASQAQTAAKRSCSAFWSGLAKLHFVSHYFRVAAQNSRGKVAEGQLTGKAPAYRSTATAASTSNCPACSDRISFPSRRRRAVRLSCAGPNRRPKAAKSDGNRPPFEHILGVSETNRKRSAFGKAF
jgi:hypothetical protein